MEALNKIAVIGNLIGETEKMALTLKFKKKKGVKRNLIANSVWMGQGCFLLFSKQTSSLASTALQ